MTKLSENALTTLTARYFLRNEKGEVIEDVDGLWDRIASAIAGVENEDKRSFWFGVFRRLLDNLDFLPNTPTIMNAGLPKGQLSACYVLPIEDSIEGIFETLKVAAKIHQSGGGTGFSFGRLRPKDSIVDSKQGVASGPLSFSLVYDMATEIMKQGGKRKGANMKVQRVDHPDILEFIDAKMTPNVLTNFNVSVAITDDFMRALANDEQYELTHPKTGVVGKLRAKDVWDRIAHNAWKSAEPGLIFIDRVNEKSAYWEPIEATNPCGEQPLPPWGSCNLGSINLANFVLDAGIDWGRLSQVTRDAVRFLDNVIDANCYPTPQLDAHAKRYRNIGLGVMGWADALIKLGIPYNDRYAIELADEVQEFINVTAHNYSVELGIEKGLPEAAPFKTFFTYSSSLRRNATLTTIAPTGSLCIIAGCSSGCEPNFAFEYEQHVLDQILIWTHPLLTEARKFGWYSEGIFIDAHKVTSIQHVDMQAAFQKNCDSAISKTINLPNDATVEDVQCAYVRAYETDCKGVTVYRDGSREGVLHKRESDVPTESVSEDAMADVCCTTPNIVRESGCETCKNCGISKCLIA